MINNSYRKLYKENSASNDVSSGQVRNSFPAARSTEKSRARVYKSPNSTPTSSPVPNKKVSRNEFIQCFSEKKSKAQNGYYRQKVKMQEKIIEELKEENARLVKAKKTENWGHEIFKKNGDLEKIENQLRYFNELLGSEAETDALLDAITEKDQKIADLEKELVEARKKCEEYEKTVSPLKSENKKLAKIVEAHKKCLRQEDYDLLFTFVKKLESSLEVKVGENKSLKEKLSKITSENQTGFFAQISQDIGRIKKEMAKLVMILEDVSKGKEISLKSILGIDVQCNSDPKQVFLDIQAIKSDINKILEIISDIHADQCASIACRTH